MDNVIADNQEIVDLKKQKSTLNAASEFNNITIRYEKRILILSFV